MQRNMSPSQLSLYLLITEIIMVTVSSPRLLLFLPEGIKSVLLQDGQDPCRALKQYDLSLHEEFCPRNVLNGALSETSPNLWAIVPLDSCYCFKLKSNFCPTCHFCERNETLIVSGHCTRDDGISWSDIDDIQSLDQLNDLINNGTWCDSQKDSRRRLFAYYHHHPACLNDFVQVGQYCYRYGFQPNATANNRTHHSVNCSLFIEAEKSKEYPEGNMSLNILLVILPCFIVVALGTICSSIYRRVKKAREKQEKLKEDFELRIVNPHPKIERKQCLSTIHESPWEDHEDSLYEENELKEYSVANDVKIDVQEKAT